MTRFDVVIVGAGMAGASLAAELAGQGRVLLLEAEPQPGYHATGRSAAFWTETYGGPAVQPLTSASHALLAAPPPGFAETGFLRPRGALHLAGPAEAAALADFATRFADSGVTLHALDEAAVRARVPRLRAGPWQALWEPSTADIDVAALHAAYLRAARRGGVVLRTGAPLAEARRVAGGWRLVAGGSAIAAGLLVNAAGAWADAVAAIAGAAPLGIRPYRRTMAQLRVEPPAPAALPLVLDIAGRFYFKPEAGGRLWLTPHDETACPPGDAAPEEIDIARALDRFERVADWPVAAVERRWAGLRSFAPDRLPVYGADPACPGFFWFAGQGGFGIQTAPAAARLAAALIHGAAAHPSVAAIDPVRYAPGRASLAG
ncbi:NAD(P)/FAD-dependent oxidoreductase [Sphingomonas morindae]|uniref:FAD-binding oxidoreductase n=1 Tax=Sphingomonas morindae TaxID=1541170 RepID=A0ABY4X527_9SPHN|nr:FAD-dependent oxidoreductase [Sphingomonas morindae]USI71942.1 FAD-binding oxidoreductase [Sphingomonas morindae]